VKFFIDNIYNSILLGLAVLSGAALLMQSLQRRGSKVSLLQATQMMNQGKTLILDVRETAQFATSHLRDAKNIPLKELPQKIGELDKFKSKSVIVLCQSGVQASRATAQLQKAGFNDVYSLDGGLLAWQAQGLPTTR
jgi:rhodanese-related sulfurtransferase